MPKLPKGSWLNVEDPSAEELSKLSKKTGIPIRQFKRALDEDEHSRVSGIDGYAEIILRVPFLSEKNESFTTSCAFYINDSVLITLHKKHFSTFDDVSSQLQDGLGQVAGPADLFCFIFSEMMRVYQKVADIMEDHLDELEDLIFADPTAKEVVREIFSIKKTLIYFYKALTANREVVLALQKGYSGYIGKKHFGQLQFIYHDITQLIDLIETLREIITSTLEIHVSGISNRLNEAMKKLTVYGSIILIPTLIASIYGMNFRYMPELHWRYGYFFSLGLMAVSSLAIYLYFRRNEWI